MLHPHTSIILIFWCVTRVEEFTSLSPQTACSRSGVHFTYGIFHLFWLLGGLCLYTGQCTLNPGWLSVCPLWEPSHCSCLAFLPLGFTDQFLSFLPLRRWCFSGLHSWSWFHSWLFLCVMCCSGASPHLTSGGFCSLSHGIFLVY